MSRGEIDRIMDEHEAAAAVASVDVQMAFAGLRFSTRKAAEVGAIPNGRPVDEAADTPPTTALRRVNLVDQATIILFEAVRDAGLDGQPVNEIDLSLQMGVARTTVRQALIRLAGIGVVDTSKVPPVFSARDIPKKPQG